MSHERDIEKKLSSLLTKMAIVVSLLFALFAVLLVRESAVIKGWDPKKDAFKEETYLYYFKKDCIEGAILDCNNNEITVASDAKGSELPIKDGYAYSFGWILGTNSEELSLRDGIRDIYGYELYDQSHKGRGSTISLTIDSEMQRSAYIALDQVSDNGSIIVLDNETGAIKAFATRGPVPYNGNDQVSFSNESLNVAESQYMRGIYEQDAPASVFKLVTLACAIENGIDFTADDLSSFYDDGTYDYQDGSALTNYKNKVYGTIDVQAALDHSVNTYFGYLADKLGKDALSNLYDNCMIGKKITIDFRNSDSNTLKSSYDLSANSASISHSGIGQGLTQITPLHICSIISSFANEGKMMQPFMVQKVDGSTDYHAKVKQLSQTVRKETCDILNQYAHQTALSYGFSEAECGWVCAKSGTAEFERDKVHSYFVGYNQKYTILISCNDVSTSSALSATMKSLLMQFKVD